MKYHIILLLISLSFINCTEKNRTFQEYSNKVDFIFNSNVTVNDLRLKAKGKKVYRKYKESITKKEIENRFSNTELEFEFDSTKTIREKIQFLASLNSDELILELNTEIKIGIITIDDIKYELVEYRRA